MAQGDELLGYIDPNGRHRPGLLERSLQEDAGSTSIGCISTTTAFQMIADMIVEIKQIEDL